MTKHDDIDIEGLEQRIAAREKEQAEEFYGSLASNTKREEESQGELNELFAKTILSQREAAEEERAAAIEDAKANAEQAVESRYESEGVKSEHTKEIDAAYKSLLGNIPGPRD